MTAYPRARSANMTLIAIDQPQKYSLAQLASHWDELKHPHNVLKWCVC